jgi:hypothetical protein
MITSSDQLVMDLHDVGVEVSSVWDLVNSKNQYRPAVPVLIDWLEHFDERVSTRDRDKLFEGIVRALSIPAARPVAVPILISEFNRKGNLQNNNLQWVIGNALSVVADDSYFVELAQIARQRDYGTARQMIVLGFGNSKRPEAIPLLADLLDDDDVVLQALSALQKLHPANLIDLISKLVDYPNETVRKSVVKIAESEDHVPRTKKSFRPPS